MAIQAFRMGDFHAAQHKLASGDQLMNIVANSNVNHALNIKTNGPVKKQFRPVSGNWLDRDGHGDAYSGATRNVGGKNRFPTISAELPVLAERPKPEPHKSGADCPTKRKIEVSEH
jgi:hypothetical protein